MSMVALVVICYHGIFTQQVVDIWQTHGSYLKDAFMLFWLWPVSLFYSDNIMSSRHLIMIFTLAKKLLSSNCFHLPIERFICQCKD